MGFFRLYVFMVIYISFALMSNLTLIQLTKSIGLNKVTIHSILFNGGVFFDKTRQLYNIRLNHHLTMFIKRNKEIHP
jgi:hypothetical protein